jgi:hypothetical protein
MRSPNIFGPVFKIVYGRRAQRKDRQGRILGSDLIDIVESLEIPGMNVERDGVPAATGKNQNELIQGLCPMNLDTRSRSCRQRLRELGPSEIFPQEKKVKR